MLLTLYQPDTRHLAVYDADPMQVNSSLCSFTVGAPPIFKAFCSNLVNLSVITFYPVPQGAFGEISMWFGEQGEVKKVVNYINSDERLNTKSKTIPIIAGRIYEIVVSAAAAGVEGAFAFTACGRDVSVKARPFLPVNPGAAALMAKRGATSA